MTDAAQGYRLELDAETALAFGVYAKPVQREQWVPLANIMLEEVAYAMAELYASFVWRTLQDLASDRTRAVPLNHASRSKQVAGVRTIRPILVRVVRLSDKKVVHAARRPQSGASKNA